MDSNNIDIEILYDDTFKLESDLPSENFILSVSSGVFHVKAPPRPRNRILFFLPRFEKYETYSLILTLPEKLQLENISVNMDSGTLQTEQLIAISTVSLAVDMSSIDVTNIETETLNTNIDLGNMFFKVVHAELANLNIDAGEIVVEMLDTRYLKGNVDMGNLKLNSVNSMRTEISVNMGGVVLYGNLLGRTFLDVDTGKISASITGNANEYGYTATSDMMGSIKVENQEYNAGNSIANSNNSALNQLELSCDMGLIEVNFVPTPLSIVLNSALMEIL